MESQSRGVAEEMQFKLRQIVWAKIIGYPWWPARVTQLPSTRSPAFRVDFFYDNSHAFLLPPKILKYEDMRSNFDQHRQIPKGLRKAISEADKLFQEEGDPRTASDLSQAPVEEPISRQKQLLKSPIPRPLLQENIEIQRIAQQDQLEYPESSQHLQPNQTASPHRTYSREQREQYVQALLRKYRLLNIPKVSIDQSLSGKPEKRKNVGNHIKSGSGRRTHEPKRKMISKQSSPRQSLAFLLTRKIYSVLKGKEELSVSQRKQISCSLGREVLGSGGEGVSGLFKWLVISPASTIASFYQNWGCMQGEKEKSSNMTTQQ